jgi:hypothetical protein
MVAAVWLLRCLMGAEEKGVEWSNGLIALVAAMLSHKIGAVMQSSPVHTASERLTGMRDEGGQQSTMVWEGRR